MGPVRGAPLTAYLSHFRGAAPALVGSAVLLGLSGLLPGVAVLALREALDALQQGTPAGAYLAVLVGVATLQAVSMVVRSVITRRLAAQLVHRLRVRLHRRLHELWPPDPSSVGERLAALSHEADELQYGVSALVTALRNPIAVLVLAGTAVSIAPGLALVAAGVAPILVGITALGGWAVRRTTRQWAMAHRALLAELQDQQAGLRTAVDLGAVDLQVARAEALSAKEAVARARRDWVRTLPPALVQWGIALGLVSLVGWGSVAVMEGSISVGGLVGFVAAVALLQRPITGLTEVWTLLQRSLGALERIETVLEGPTAAPPTGAVFRLDGVTVAGRLGPVSFSLTPGEKVALVGPSGSGKSTLLGVLAGLLEGEGTIETGRALLLRQDPWVFDRSVRDNLLLASPTASDERLREALEEVGLQVALDRGLEEAMGERGDRFSGGERQRLCLARALLSDAPVLLLDEATSEVDPARAAALVARLMTSPRTVVFASHDATFARVADRVVWLDEGRIRAVGPHSQLWEADARYRAHWDSGAAA